MLMSVSYSSSLSMIEKPLRSIVTSSAVTSRTAVPGAGVSPVQSRSSVRIRSVVMVDPQGTEGRADADGASERPTAGAATPRTARARMTSYFFMDITILSNSWK